jgi:hypothetical protein
MVLSAFLLSRYLLNDQLLEPKSNEVELLKLWSKLPKEI